MTAPKRWVDDPDADAGLRDTLRGAGGARRLDDVTRRRLSHKVTRAATLPAVAAGWLFVKSAAAALGVVVASAGVATYAGVIDWPTQATVQPAPSKPSKHVPVAASRPAAPVVAEPEVVSPPEPQLNPTPTLPVTNDSLAPTPSSSASLSAEAQLLEQARREMRRAPAVALQIAAEHAQRFPRAQLGSERALIQIEALHRLGRDAEARALARTISAGTAGGLYAERIRQLLGENAGP